MTGEEFERRRAWTRTALVAVYLAAGILHLATPEPFVRITPDFVPAPRFVIMATGLCEIFGAVGLLIPSLRRTAGVMLALYAVCVFPANIKHALDQFAVPGLPFNWWYHAPRLALQPAIVWWALFAGGLVSWPFRCDATRALTPPKVSDRD